MTYEEFIKTAADDRTDVVAAVIAKGETGNQSSYLRVGEFDAMLAQRRLQLLSGWACVVVEMPCYCQYVVSAEHMGIQSSCNRHIVKHLTGQ
jgi:hypothetical protein